MDKKYYITTPIYYLNDSPHIGHAYTTLACDFIARFKRLDGFDVHFLTGTDEYGQKIYKTANTLGITPTELVNSNVLKFKELIKSMNFSNDDFIRTTDERHITFVQHIWEELYKKDAIYLGKYSGWYAVRDEAFYTEDELVDGKAPTGADVEWIEEESYFFRLSNFQEQLLKVIEDEENFILPKGKKNEVLSILRKEKLRDLSISRSRMQWGIPVPGDDKHVIYVWLDALFNYISALKSPKNLYDKYWPADLHVIGKDILRFHAIYWSAFIIALGLPLPKRIFAHGWWLNDGHKISKSLGNTIDPFALVSEFGTDYVRYFLMSDVVFGNDGNYTRDRLVTRINSELVNNIGNLIQRVMSFIYKNCDGKIPAADKSKFTTEDIELLNRAYSIVDRMKRLIDIQDLNAVIEEICKLGNEGNVYVDQQAPWSLKKNDPNRMRSVLYILSEVIRIIAISLQPIVPNSAAKLITMLNLQCNNNCTENMIPFSNATEFEAFKYEHKINEPQIIFNRLIV